MAYIQVKFSSAAQKNALMQAAAKRNTTAAQLIRTALAWYLADEFPPDDAPPRARQRNRDMVNE